MRAEISKNKDGEKFLFLALTEDEGKSLQILLDSDPDEVTPEEHKLAMAMLGMLSITLKVFVNGENPAHFGSAMPFPFPKPSSN